MPAITATVSADEYTRLRSVFRAFFDRGLIRHAGGLLPIRDEAAAWQRFLRVVLVGGAVAMAAQLEALSRRVQAAEEAERQRLTLPTGPLPWTPVR